MTIDAMLAQGPDADSAVMAQIREAAASCARAQLVCMNRR